MICLLVMTDGRQHIADTIRSAEVNVLGPVTAAVIHDDSGDSAHRAELAERYPDFDVIGGERVGFGGAISRAWKHLRTIPVEFVFHIEDDFTFNRPVDLAALAAVMRANPHLAQMALRRQPWNPGERAAGGIVEQHPADYTDCTDGQNYWLEHRRFFTTNPSLYRTGLCERGWPSGPHSEGRFSLDLFEDPQMRCAFWGARDSGEWVHHIGEHRNGTGY
jgi:hypothetical protein